MSILDDIRTQRRKDIAKDSREGLAYCNLCGEEYIDAQAVTIEDEKSCPHCKKPEFKTYYYQN